MARRSNMGKGFRLAIAIVILIIAVLVIAFAAFGMNKTPEEKVRSEVAKAKDAGSEYVSPVDFELLHEQNPDICAWLEIEGTDISYPVLKSEEAGDSMYLDHDSQKNYSVSGSLFIDEYNSADFDDPVSVIYGHHMKSGEYFGNLQSYYQDAEGFEKYSEMTLYLPEEKRVYQVFAAVPYSKIHILYNYDFASEMDFYVFFDRVFDVRALTANTDRDNYPEFGQKVLILSTCLEGDNTQRYLVMGREK